MKKSKIESCTTDQDHHTDVATDKAVDESRRTFMATSALIGAAGVAGAVGLGLNPTAVHAKGSRLKNVGASGFQPLEVNSPMAKWKKPQSLEFVTAATRRYSFRNWQSGNDDSVYYNLNLSRILQVQCRDATRGVQCSGAKYPPRSAEPHLQSPRRQHNPAAQGLPCRAKAGTGHDDGPQGQGCL